MDGGEKKEVRRPMNAFLIFCKRHRGVVREQNPDKDNRSVTRVLGDLWANLGEEKKIYTNLAKQYKDAFMKANPNYKWHSADKSQCSSSKMTSKPTNSRVIKNVADIHTDGSIIPGKLADPEKMGGLNLLLMADKETCDGRSSSSSLLSAVPFSVTRTTAASFSSMPVNTVSNTTEQSAVSNSALLQLAEMCTSELHGSTDNSKSMSGHLIQRPLTGPPTSLSISHTNNPPMQPPKKRVRHWSLSEADGAHETTNDNSYREDSFGNMFLQNAASHKLRCTSLGSTVCSDDRYLSLEKYRSTPSRRKLSSSATESIPSPSGPFADGVEDGDSPVFSPDITKLENSFSAQSKFESRQCFDQTNENIYHCTESAGKNTALVSEMPLRSFQMDIDGHHFYHKSLKPEKPNLVATSLQVTEPLSVVTAGLSRPLLWQEREESPLSDLQQQHSSFVSFYTAASPETCSDREPERNNNPDLHILKEPKNANSKLEAISSGSLNLQVSSHSMIESSPSPKLRLSTNRCDDKSLNNKNIHHTSSRYESTGDTNTVCDLRYSSSFAHEPASFTSILSEGRIASILNNLDAPAPKFPWNFSNIAHSSSKATCKINNEPYDTYTKVEQSSPAQKTTSSADMDKSGIVNKQTCNLNMIEPGSSAIRIPPTNQSHTFSKGKLKKTWTERMLIEAMLKDDPVQTKTKEEDGNREVHVKNDPVNIVTNSQVETNTNQNIESKYESSKMRNLNNAGVSSGYSENADLIMSAGNGTPPHSSHQALLLLNRPLCSSEELSSHARNPALFNTSSSHTKLMLQLSQNQQPLKLDLVKPKTDFDEVKIKLEPGDTGSLTNRYQDQKCCYVNQQCHDAVGKVDVVSNESGVPSNKQVLNQIAACGKKFMDRIVEQLCKTDFTGDIRQVSVNSTVTDGPRSKSPLMKVKSEPESFFGSCDLALKKENTVEKFKSETALVGKFVNEVCGLPTQKDKLISGRRTAGDGNRPCSNDTNSAPVIPSSLSSHAVKAGVSEESTRKLETSRHTTSPPIDACFQNQWSSVMLESCDHSDLNEENGIQPVRKSRRANRGQKYQELIKEGFIQPSRERLAARNADRHGRSFGSREEFEKMEMKRTLKRSASERDPPSDSPSVSIIPGGNDALDGSMEKRFASGDFDLEKEIESLPVCSLDQLDKKKMMRRRCDSNTIVSSTQCHKNNGDVTSCPLSRSSLGNTQSKLSPFGGAVYQVEVDMSESGCPAPRVQRPKEEKPIEPITGSRKRKARKHCITRISVLDEKTSTTQVSVKTCLQPLPSPLPHKKLCAPSEDLPLSSISSCNKTMTESSRLVPQTHMSVQVQSESSKQHLGMAKDFKTERIENKVFPALPLTGKNVASKENFAVKTPVPTFNTLPSISVNSALISSLHQPLLSSLVVPSLNSTILLPSSSSVKRCESQPVIASSTTHRKNNKTSLLSQHRPTQKKVPTTVTQKTHATGTILRTSSSLGPALIMVTGHPIVPVKDNTPLVAIKSTISEVSSKQFVTLPNHRQKTKIPQIQTVTNKELLQKKSLDKKPRKIDVGKMKMDMSHHQNNKLQTTVTESQCALKRKFTEKKGAPIFSKSSSTPLVSALLGHSDLSSAIKLAEQNHGKVTSLPHLWSSGNEKTSLYSVKGIPVASTVSSRGCAKAARIELPTPALSAESGKSLMFRTQFIPLSVGQNNNTAFISETTCQEIVPKSTPSSTPATKTFTPSLETSSLNERLKFADTANVKPHLSAFVPTKVIGASSSGIDTAKVRPQQSFPTDASFVQVSGIVSQLQPQHISLVATSNTLMTSDLYSGRTFTSTPYTSTTLHNSLLSQMPCPSSSSLSTSTISSCTPTFVSSVSPLHSSPSSSSALLSSPTVISLAASSPSTKNDIVSYTVIGSSSVIDAGSPHMIGSPHLPESPSVAIVQS